MREPEPPPAIGATGLAAPTEPVPAALWSIRAKEFALPGLAPVWAGAGGAGGAEAGFRGGGAGAGGAGGANAVSRAEMRARTASMLTPEGSAYRRRAFRPQTADGRPQGL